MLAPRHLSAVWRACVVRMSISRNGSRTPELSDAEAYELLQSVAYESIAGGRAFGHNFRTSVQFYRYEGSHYPKWEAPPRRFRLGIDDNIDELLGRTSAPRIEPSSKVAALRINGPYRLVRLHLELIVSYAIDPAQEEARAALITDVINDIEDAEEAMARLTDWGLRHPHIGWLLGRCSEDLDAGLHGLRQIRRLLIEERQKVRANERTAWRPRKLWKADFVGRMAHLWRLLTQDEPSRRDESLFGQFVYSAWNSLDDEMPEVSFARAIRERPRERP